MVIALHKFVVTHCLDLDHFASFWDGENRWMPLDHALTFDSEAEAHTYCIKMEVTGYKIERIEIRLPERR
jgi:hypothetical protein